MYQVTHRNGERFSAAKAYLARRARANLQVLTGAQVLRVLLDDRRPWASRSARRRRHGPR